MEWQTIKELWPISTALVVIGVRFEMGQLLNRQRIVELERRRVEDASERTKDNTAIHSRVSRHETKTDETLNEIRADIKELIKMQVDYRK